MAVALRSAHHIITLVAKDNYCGIARRRNYGVRPWLIVLCIMNVQHCLVAYIKTGNNVISMRNLRKADWLIRLCVTVIRDQVDNKVIIDELFTYHYKNLDSDFFPI